ncbi:TetR family transcriptional regulator [Eubacteriaceae bacterium ES2]|nr:TetR family transcriptional regulator [Eubacteriaceae bacterium ES2]
MGKYKVGIETKEKIYETSKSLFYEKGYTNTTCAQIAKSSNSNVGLINYYFGAKSGLGIEVNNQLMRDFKATILTKLKDAEIETSLLLQTTVEMRFLNQALRQNKNYARFYFNLMEENVIYKQQSIMLDFYDNLAKSCSLSLEPYEVEYITYANMGSTQGVSLAYDAGLIDCSPSEFVNMNIRMCLANTHLDSELIEQTIQESLEISKKINVQIVKNFKVE